VYWAFISYSRADIVVAKWLQQAIESYRVPYHMVGRSTRFGEIPRHLRPIFRDHTDLPADADLRARIDEALNGSAFLIVVCSPRAAASKWVNNEIACFRRLHGDDRILSVIVSGEPGNESNSCFPPALLSRDRQVNTARFEPIAADLRPHGDGRRLVRLKLIAGMLGVGLDEIARRDDQRRHRKLVGVTASSLAATAVMGALAASAIFSRNEAQSQRAHAESLIEFMLTDLRKNLEPGGHLDLMDGAGREALAYYQAQSARTLDASSLSRRARALRLVGEIRVQRGDLSEALGSFQQASATTAELVARAPSDGSILFNHAQNVFWVGEIARQRGDMSQAEVSFREYKTLAERLVTLDRQNDNWRAEVGYAENALGTVLLQRGEVEAAAMAFQRLIAIASDLTQHHPENVDAQMALGQGHAWLADCLQRQGRLSLARDHREVELAIYRMILQRDPTLRQARFAGIVAGQMLGRLAMTQGDRQNALAYFRDCVSAGDSLLENERNNMDLTAVVAIAYVELADAELTADRIEVARAAHKRGAVLIGSALRHDDSVALWRYYADWTHLLEAAIDARSGMYEEALRIDQQLATQLPRSMPRESSADSLWLLTRARLQMGDDLAALGRMPQARESWSAISSDLKEPLQDYEPRVLLLLKEADKRLARTTEMVAVAQRLEAISAR
jgi:tetratricopeptide (TPR) repeat protein